MPYTFRGIELPENLKESLDAYANDGRPTGDFLQSCISNNLNLAIAYADDTSLAVIPAVVGYLYNLTPSQCWGRSQSYGDWIEAKRKKREATA